MNVWVEWTEIKNPYFNPVKKKMTTKKQRVASLTQQGTPAGTWGSSAVFLLSLLLHHFSAPPLPHPLTFLYSYPSSADKFVCQSFFPSSLLLEQHLTMPLPPSCCGKAVVFWWKLEGMLSCRWDFATCERAAVCQVGLVPVLSVLKGHAGTSRAWVDLDLMQSSEEAEQVQGRERLLHRGHTIAGHPTLVMLVSTITCKKKQVKSFLHAKKGENHFYY